MPMLRVPAEGRVYRRLKRECEAFWKQTPCCTSEVRLAATAILVKETVGFAVILANAYESPVCCAQNRSSA